MAYERCISQLPHPSCKLIHCRWFIAKYIGGSRHFVVGRHLLLDHHSDAYILATDIDEADSSCDDDLSWHAEPGFDASWIPIQEEFIYNICSLHHPLAGRVWSFIKEQHHAPCRLRNGPVALSRSVPPPASHIRPHSSFRLTSFLYSRPALYKRKFFWNRQVQDDGAAAKRSSLLGSRL